MIRYKVISIILVRWYVKEELNNFTANIFIFAYRVYCTYEMYCLVILLVIM